MLLLNVLPENTEEKCKFRSHICYNFQAFKTWKSPNIFGENKWHNLFETKLKNLFTYERYAPERRWLVFYKSRSGEEQGINQGENKLLGMASLSYVLEGAEQFLVALNGCIKWFLIGSFSLCRISNEFSVVGSRQYGMLALFQGPLILWKGRLDPSQVLNVYWGDP